MIVISRSLENRFRGRRRSLVRSGLRWIQGNGKRRLRLNLRGNAMLKPRIFKLGTLMLAQCVIFLTVSFVGAQQVPFFVIVHPDNATEMMSRQLISNIFLKKTTRWGPDLSVELVDLKPESSIREAFSREVHKRSTAEIVSYWSEQGAAGGPTAPLEVSGAEAVAFVRQTPGAIAYVSTSSSLEGVKLVPLVIPPVAIKKVPPNYSKRAFRFRIEGDVVLRLLINEKGRVEDVTVLKELEHGLTEEAIRAVKKWRFEPATSGGIPLSTEIDVTVTFGL